MPECRRQRRGYWLTDYMSICRVSPGPSRGARGPPRARGTPSARAIANTASHASSCIMARLYVPGRTRRESASFLLPYNQHQSQPHCQAAVPARTGSVTLSLESSYPVQDVQKSSCSRVENPYLASARTPYILFSCSYILSIVPLFIRCAPFQCRKRVLANLATTQPRVDWVARRGLEMLLRPRHSVRPGVQLARAGGPRLLSL